MATRRPNGKTPEVAGQAAWAATEKVVRVDAIPCASQTRCLGFAFFRFARTSNLASTILEALGGWGEAKLERRDDNRGSLRSVSATSRAYTASCAPTLTTG